MARFQSFTSGSCGNCCYIEGPEGKAVLIDAGTSLKRVKTTLASAGIGMDSIAAILVTHDHYDHIRNLGSFCKHLGIPVWATPRLHAALACHFATAEYIAPCRRELVPQAWNNVAPGISVRYFGVSHDATDTVGFALVLGEHKMVFMTDLGAVPKDAMDLSRQADTVVIESNYDVGMLLGGDYPYELKMRIVHDAGHLSNDDCAEAIKSFFHPGLKNLFLCHLSAENNTRTLAYESAREALRKAGAAEGSVQLRILPRGEATPLLSL